jgi:hypothetical protein
MRGKARNLIIINEIIERRKNKTRRKLNFSEIAVWQVCCNLQRVRYVLEQIIMYREELE